MRKMTVTLAFAATVSLITVAVMSMVSGRATSYAQTRPAKRKIYNEGRDEWAYKGGKNPAW